MASARVKKKLSEFGELIEFSSVGITYLAISGHPDVFMAQLPDQSFVVAPNLPVHILYQFQLHKIEFQFGKAKVGLAYPKTAYYNAKITSNHLIHNLKHTDIHLLQACRKLTNLHVEQGYAACNIIAFPNNIFLTADKGIYDSLKVSENGVHLINDQDVVLKGFTHGFWGGACGLHNNRLFICGSLRHHVSGSLIRNLAEQASIEIIELYDGMVEDVGGILFYDS